MQILIEEPIAFFSPMDEDMFFHWLMAIPCVSGVGGVGPDLRIRIAKPDVTESEVKDLIALFHRYGLDKRPLAELDQERFAWFRDPAAYWHQDIFGQ